MLSDLPLDPVNNIFIKKHVLIPFSFFNILIAKFQYNWFPLQSYDFFYATCNSELRRPPKGSVVQKSTSGLGFGNFCQTMT